MADDAAATHPADGCKRLQPSEPEVAHDGSIALVIVGQAAKERQGADQPLETIHNKILRFPPNLRRVGTERDYIAPRTLALGPYYHGVPELRAMEEIKHRVAEFFFEKLAKPWKEIFEEFIPIARMARSCYADVSALAGITDDKFFSMMFVDAIFLVHFIASFGSDPRLDSMVGPYMVDIFRDILLLENQIPWFVTRFFMALWPLSQDDIVQKLTASMTGFFLEEAPEVDLSPSYVPSHLLCLIRTNRAGRRGPIADLRRLSGLKGTISAAELTEMGIKLKAGKATGKFSDMDLVKGHLFADLVLLPLYLESITACWLVNMVALETYTENFMTGGECSVTSYLAFIASLMFREKDVRELRNRGIVDGSSDKQTLDFFEGLSLYLTPGHAYFRILVDIQEYKKGRRLWIAVYSFLYKNWKTIATVLPIVSVLVGILKTLLSLKQH